MKKRYFLAALLAFGGTQVALPAEPTQSQSFGWKKGKARRFPIPR